MVSRGDTMHAEAVRVTYDASVITLRDLLDVFFKHVDFGIVFHHVFDKI